MSLPRLSLREIPIDAAGLDALQKLSQLKMLSLYNHRLTGEQTAAIKRALPGCSCNF